MVQLINISLTTLSIIDRPYLNARRKYSIVGILTCRFRGAFPWGTFCVCGSLERDWLMHWISKTGFNRQAHSKMIGWSWIHHLSMIESYQLGLLLGIVLFVSSFFKYWAWLRRNSQILNLNTSSIVAPVRLKDDHWNHLSSLQVIELFSRADCVFKSPQNLGSKIGTET